MDLEDKVLGCIMLVLMLSVVGFCLLLGLFVYDSFTAKEQTTTATLIEIQYTDKDAILILRGEEQSFEVKVSQTIVNQFPINQQYTVHYKEYRYFDSTFDERLVLNGH